MIDSVKGKIVAFRNDRLGGRINALVNAIRVGSDYGVDVAMSWPSHEAASPELQHPEELFSPDFLQKHFVHDVGFTELHREALALGDIRREDPQDILTTRALKGQVFLCTEALRPVAFPWEPPDEIAARLPEFLNHISFSEPVTRMMVRLKEMFSDKSVVAYHMRRGDIIDINTRASNVLWESKYVPRIFYERHIERLLRDAPDTEVLFFSDTFGEIEAFKTQYAQVRTFADLVGGTELTIVQRDFLEIFAMSLCDTIYAPAASAFSSVARNLGNGRIVPLRSDLSDEETAEAMEDLTQRMKDCPDQFLGDADLGQNIPFIVAHHAQNGTQERSRDVMQRMLDRGFDRAYIYDVLAYQMFLAGDYDGARGVIDTLRSRTVHNEDSNALAYCYAGMTALLAGEWDDAVALAHQANWLTPIQPHARALVNVLTGHGLMNDTNSFPVDKRIIGLRTLMKPSDGELFDRLNAAASRYSGAPEIAGRTFWLAFQHDLRDWTDLQGAKMPPSFANREKIDKLVGFFKTGFAKILHEPHIRAALSTLLRNKGDLDDARTEILAALTDEPDTPLFHKRLADLYTAEDKPRRALVAMEEAMNSLSAHDANQICYHAHFGLTLFRAGDTNTAMKVFESLASRDHGMPEIYLVTADILRRRAKHRDLALSVTQRATQKFYGSSRLMRLEAKLLERNGKGGQADLIRQKLISWNRPHGNLASRIPRPPKGN